jgi:hypothetical protein
MIDEPLWQQLAGEHTDATGVVRRRIHGDRPVDLFIGVTQPGQRRLLSLEVAAGLAMPALPDTGALRVLVLPGASASDRLELRITLDQPDMRAVFTPFVNDVVDTVSVCPTDQDALDTLAERFRHWRNLLSGGSGGLGPRELQGLFGELWTLQHLVGPAVGIPASVAAWTGPDRERRDFLVGETGVEVKTTTTTPPASVRITSELQLDGGPLGALVLVALELDTAIGDTGTSVVDLVRAITESAGEELDRFERSLLAYGYHSVHAPSYDVVRFTVRARHAFDVQTGFPRLTVADLPPGIGDVHYELSLGAAAPWQIDDSVLDAVLHNNPIMGSER